jgi:hypothetical protein
VPEGGSRTQKYQEEQYPKVGGRHAGQEIGGSTHYQGGTQDHAPVLEQSISRKAGRQAQDSAGALFGCHQSAHLDIRQAKVSLEQREDDRKNLLVPVNDYVPKGQGAKQGLSFY